MNVDQFTEVARQRTYRLNAYRELPVQAQSVLQLMAVAYEAMDLAQVIQACNELHQLDERYPRFSHGTFKPIFTELMVQGLILPGQNQGYRCDDLLVEILTREAVNAGIFEAMAEAIEETLPLTYIGSSDQILFQNLDQLMRVARWAIYRQQLDEVPRLLKMFEDYAYAAVSVTLEEVMERVFHNPFDAVWARTFPQPVVEVMLELALRSGMRSLAPMQAQFACLKAMCLDPEVACSDKFLLCGVEQFILRNQLANAEICLQRVSPEMQGEIGQYWAWLTFLRGNVDRAIELYELAYKTLKQPLRKRKVFFDDLCGVFFVLALVQRGTPDDFEAARHYASILATRKQPHVLSQIYARLVLLIQFLQGEMTHCHELVESFDHEVTGIDALFTALCIYWCDADRLTQSLTLRVEMLCDLANQGGQQLVGDGKCDAVSCITTVKSICRSSTSNAQIEWDDFVAVDRQTDGAVGAGIDRTAQFGPAKATGNGQCRGTSAAHGVADQTSGRSRCDYAEGAEDYHEG